jgi:hypothetical protein
MGISDRLEVRRRRPGATAPVGEPPSAQAPGEVTSPAEATDPRIRLDVEAEAGERGVAPPPLRRVLRREAARRSGTCRRARVEARRRCHLVAERAQGVPRRRAEGRRLVPAFAGPMSFHTTSYTSSHDGPKQPDAARSPQRRTCCASVPVVIRRRSEADGPVARVPWNTGSPRSGRRRRRRRPPDRRSADGGAPRADRVLAARSVVAGTVFRRPTPQ